MQLTLNLTFTEIRLMALIYYVKSLVNAPIDPYLSYGSYRGFTSEGCPYIGANANSISQIPYISPITPGGG